MIDRWTERSLYTGTSSGDKIKLAVAQWGSGVAGLVEEGAAAAERLDESVCAKVGNKLS